MFTSVTLVWLKSSEQGLNGVYTHLGITRERNCVNDEAVQIMRFLRIFGGIYMQLSWQAMSW